MIHIEKNDIRTIYIYIYIYMDFRQITLSQK